jgi:hypothetical protein
MTQSYPTGIPASELETFPGAYAAVVVLLSKHHREFINIDGRHAPLNDAGDLRMVDALHALEPYRVACAFTCLTLGVAGQRADAKDVGGAPLVRAALEAALPSLPEEDKITASHLFKAILAHVTAAFALGRANFKASRIKPTLGVKRDFKQHLLTRVRADPPRKAPKGGAAAFALSEEEEDEALADVQLDRGEAGDSDNEGGGEGGGADDEGSGS